MEYDYKCWACEFTQAHHFSIKDTIPDKIVYYHGNQSSINCKKRLLHRVYTVPNVTGINRFGTRSPKDNQRDK